MNGTKMCFEEWEFRGMGIRRTKRGRTHESSNFRIDFAGICLPVKPTLAENKLGPFVELLLLLLPPLDGLLVGDSGHGRVKRLRLLVPRTQQQKRAETSSELKFRILEPVL